MPLPAQVETLRPSIADTEKGAISEIAVPITPNIIHDSTTEAVSSQLARAGHPQTPEQVSADGEANTILAGIENNNLGAEVVTDATDRLSKGIENTMGDLGGSHRNYSVEGQKGHSILISRIKKRVLSTKIAEKFRNFLSRKRK